MKVYSPSFFIIFYGFSVMLNSMLFAQNPRCLPYVQMGLGAQVPGMDLAKDYGSNMQVSASFDQRWNGFWLSGMGFDYFYGATVKNDVLLALRNDQGQITNNEGYPSDIRVTERGFQWYAKGGIVKSINQNGWNWLLCGGMGYLEHQVYLYDTEKKVVALQNESMKGYDRLCNGMLFRAETGVLYLSKNRYSNFYIGCDAAFALTRSRRRFAYGYGSLATGLRKDFLSGFKLCWILPLQSHVNHTYFTQ